MDTDLSNAPREAEFLFFTAPDGRVEIEVYYADESIWLTQKAMAELFQTTTQNITVHLKNIYADGEL